MSTTTTTTRKSATSSRPGKAALKVIGLGLGRTGVSILHDSLQAVLYGPNLDSSPLLGTLIDDVHAYSDRASRFRAMLSYESYLRRRRKGCEILGSNKARW